MYRMPKILKELILEVLKKVKDPELGFSIVDAGLVKDINVDEESKRVYIYWIPTSPFCPLVLAISAAMLSLLRKKLNLEGWNVRVLVDESVITAKFWNSQLSNRETVERIISNLESTGQIRYFIIE